MMLGSFKFKKVAIAGVGLMGGSLGMAIKKNHLAKEVVGVSQRQSSLVSAIKQKAIDKGYTDLPKAMANADLIILATPVESIIKLLSAIAPHLKRGCIVTDMGSAKSEIVEAAEKVLPNYVSFVGGHPMVGSEKKGVGFSRADFFEGADCILTPTKKTNKSALEKIHKFWNKIGAKIKTLDPVEHDKILSYVSHLPHILAFALMDAIPQEYLSYSSTGLKDTTRVASSSPQMWNDICLTNRKNIIQTLDEYAKCLSDLRKAILTNDNKALTDHFTKAKEKRDECFRES